MINARHINNIPLPCNTGTASPVRKFPNPICAPTVPIPKQEATKNTVVKFSLHIVFPFPKEIPGRNVKNGMIIKPYAAGNPVSFVENRYPSNNRIITIAFFSLLLISPSALYCL